MTSDPGAAGIDSAAGLGPALIAAVADGRAIRLGPGLLDRVQQQCDRARAALRDGRAVYGVSTGMGALAGVRLTAEQQLSHQRNLLLARACGGGGARANSACPLRHQCSAAMLFRSPASGGALATRY